MTELKEEDIMDKIYEMWKQCRVLLISGDLTTDEEELMQKIAEHCKKYLWEKL